MLATVPINVSKSLIMFCIAYCIEMPEVIRPFHNGRCGTIRFKVCCEITHEYRMQRSYPVTLLEKIFSSSMLAVLSGGTALSRADALGTSVIPFLSVQLYATVGARLFEAGE